ncbi:MAG TPA: glycoside hydrolase family 5 protein [Verrucomicrobiae bacterium]|nr:glycoside hydrolase family 5 protein [Verrucomicrobiae bacterium]
MKKIIVGLAVSILSALTGAAELSRVSVQGNHFVTADGKTIVFRGLDTSDPDKLDRNGQWNKHYFEMAKSWGANIVRFPVHPAAWHIHGKKNYLKLLDQGVEWAREEGLYVIIDWHSMGNLREEKFFSNSSELYPPNLYDTTQKETFDFWKTMAKHYRGNNTVAFFELFNEPTVNPELHLGTCTWPQWKELMEQVIKTIRSNGGTAVPLVAGFNFAYDLTPVANDPIDATNIGYVAHPYPMKAKPPLEKNWTHDWGFVSDKYPMILTEVGFLPPGEPGGYNPIIGDETYGDALTSYCAKHGISYTVWCFDIHWGPTLIKDWNFTPTRSGAYFKKAMSQKQP